MNRVLALQTKLQKFPFGQIIFSKLVARFAPYFTTINPMIDELRPNYMKVSMKKKRAVHNHLKTVHAIAMCNLCEFAGGICMEASIPKHRRWIPIGMEVKYLKKAESDLTAVCDLNHVDWDNCTEVICDIEVKDKNQITVCHAWITMKVSDKQKR